MTDNRPSLRIKVEEPADTNAQPLLSFEMVFENQGNVPAHIVSCEVVGRIEGEGYFCDPLDPVYSPVNAVIAASQRKTIPLKVLADKFLNPVHQFKLEVTVKYRAEIPPLYTTLFYVRHTHGSWGEPAQTNA